MFRAASCSLSRAINSESSSVFPDFFKLDALELFARPGERVRLLLPVDELLFDLTA
jgi:hypothetical protein